jgi:hypothetical protein
MSERERGGNIRKRVEKKEVTGGIKDNLIKTCKGSLLVIDRLFG